LVTASPINSSLRDFFGTNPLSQMMDQTNALAELTHKRRLSCLPVVLKRDCKWLSWNSCNSLWSNLSHWDTGRKNAGLVNSITIYANLNQNGLLKPHSGKYIRHSFEYHWSLLFDSKQEVILQWNISKTQLNFLPKNALIHHVN
jgi:DNA-directed RNA polymerase beta subunit